MSSVNDQQMAVKKIMNITCENCGLPLGLQAVIADGRLWHTQCLLCFNCTKSLSKDVFHVKDGSTFCTSCYKLMYLPRCIECFYPMKSNQVIIKAMGVKWHHKCFRCKLCRKKITHEYFVFENFPVCVTCGRQMDKLGMKAKDLLTHPSPSSGSHAHEAFTARTSHFEIDDDDDDDDEDAHHFDQDSNTSPSKLEEAELREDFYDTFKDFKKW